ncbi:MAG TPA: lmo0937 family membrane protein [Armatimonadota bacterium]
MIMTLIGLLLLFWLLGLIGHVGGSLIHLLLVVAVIVFVFDLLTGRRTTV